MENKLAIPSAIILAGVIIAGAIIYANLPRVAVPGKTPGVEEGADAFKLRQSDFVLGSPAAKVRIIEYGDFQCPFCGILFKNIEPQLINAYVKTGKAVFIWRDFAFLGQESLRSAEAARCAGEQGKFWDYHDYLFSHQNGENKGTFSDSNLKQFASSLKLDVAKFNSCFSGGKYQNAVQASTDEGRTLGVNGTPATFVNGQMISGAQSFAVFQSIIETELKK